MQGGAVVKFGNLLLLAAFAAVPASAEEIEFEGRTVEIGGDQDAPSILRMRGTRYGINATALQILDKARACISRIDGVSVAAVEAGMLTADVRADFRAMFSSRSIRSRLALEASDGYFSISQSELAYSPAPAAETPDGGYAPLVYDGGGWDNALETAVKLEDGIVDCMYR